MPGIIAASVPATLAKWSALPIKLRPVSAVVSCLLLTVLTACTGAGPADEASDAALLRDFHRLAFQTERPVLGDDGRPRARRDHLAKWTIPIKVALIDGDRPGLDAAPSDAFHRLAADHLAELAGLTGLAIRFAPPREANLLIFLAADPFAAARRHHGLFADRIVDAEIYEALLQRMEGSARCFGFLWGGWPGGRSIDFAVAFIRGDQGARTIEGCLVQEVTQVLGLMNDLEAGTDSVFSDSGRQIALTERDRLMLRLLYDRRLRPGMSWAEAEPLLRQALRELRPYARSPAPIASAVASP